MYRSCTPNAAYKINQKSRMYIRVKVLGTTSAINNSHKYVNIQNNSHISTFDVPTPSPRRHYSTATDG